MSKPRSPNRWKPKAPPKKEGPLTTCPLEWSHCQALAPHMVTEDVFECASMGVTALQALAAGAMVGPAYAVIRKRSGTCVGAFGCNPLYGTIWSLWGSLGLSEKAHILADTPEWVEKLVKMSGGHRPLHNFVSASNERTLEWLARSGCFEINEEEPIFISCAPFYHFHTLAPNQKA